MNSQAYNNAAYESVIDDELVELVNLLVTHHGANVNSTDQVRVCAYVPTPDCVDAILILIQ
jgi:CRISPR/Cas system-associated endonuclease Cas3-HD